MPSEPAGRAAVNDPAFPRLDRNVLADDGLIDVASGNAVLNGIPVEVEAAH